MRFIEDTRRFARACAKPTLRALAISGAALAIIAATGFSPASAETRTLKLYYLHTGEKIEIAYKKDGKYIDSGLQRINQFLRDWRRNEPTKMDPRLLDLVWEVYRNTGSKDYIHVVSGYRSPATNGMLRKRGRGVAKFSQHMLGKAMDFFMPDVKLSTLREAGLKLQSGGVGYYPTSGSPFVHLDTGNVRHWPRMSRQELARVFPDGKTLHLPADGKPLPGYEQAVASFEARRSGKNIVVAKAETGPAPDAKKLNVFQRWAQNFKQDQQDDEEANSLPGINAVKTSEEPAETEAPIVIAKVTEGLKDNGLPGIEMGAQAAAKLARSDALSAKQPQFEVELASVPVPARSPRRLAAGGELALAAAGAGSSANQALEALDRAGAAEKLRSQLAAGQFAVAALSAEDIESMRRTAVPAVRERSLNDRLAGSLQPARQIGAPDHERSEAENEITLARLNSSENSAAKDRTNGADRIATAIPKKNPDRRPAPQAASRTLELALAPAEDGETAAADAIRALIEANGAPTGSIRTDTARRSGEAQIGEWALASHTLRQKGSLRAPAYGLGAFRPSPDEVLRAGFAAGAGRFAAATFSPDGGVHAEFVRIERR